MIKRHKNYKLLLLSESRLNWHKERIEKNKDRLESQGVLNIFSAKKRPRRLAINNILMNERKDVRYYLGMSLDMWITHYRKVLHPDGPVTVSIAGEEYIYDQLNEYKEIRSPDWVKCYTLAYVLDEQEHMDFLRSVIPSIPKDGPFWYSFVLFLEAITTDQYELAEDKALDIIVMSMTDETTFIGREGKSRIRQAGVGASRRTQWMPICELYMVASRGEEDEFNEYLETYLLGMHDYIEEHEKEKSQDHWINMMALACCAYAHRRGMHITVEAEYIPRWLYEGDF